MASPLLSSNLAGMASPCRQASAPKIGFFPSPERMPLSPMKPNITAPELTIFEVPHLPGCIDDKENVQSSRWSNSNTKIFEDEISDKPILINLDSMDFEEAPPPPPPKRSLGRPPKTCPEKPVKSAPKVRLCSELARDGMIPAGMIAFIACIGAVSYSSEDHSFSTLTRAIASGYEDILECWLTSLVVLSLVLIAMVGIVCTYICLSCGDSTGSGKARPKTIKERPSVTEDSWRRRRTGGSVLY